MPLITKMFPSLERVREKSQVQRSKAQYDEAYDGFEEGEEGEMNNDSILDPSHKKRANPAPIIPQRSARRTSRMLEDLVNELASLRKEPTDEMGTHPQQLGSDPHESYLSSEEEASESADDYDESIIELDSDRPPSSLASRSSHEDTARVVSFTHAGKPQLIDIFSHDSPISPIVIPPRRRPSPLRLNPDSSQTRPSISSTRSSSLNALGSLARTLSRSENPKKSISSPAQRPVFLQNDPFPSESQGNKTPSPTDSPTPKTPTRIANAAWKGSIKGMQRTLSMVRKKPSIPKLSLTFAQGNTKSQETPTATPSTPPVETPNTEPIQQPPRLEQGPVTYKDIMRNVVRAPPPPAPPVSPKLSKVRTTATLLKIGRRSPKG